MSNNLTFRLLNPQIITQKLKEDLLFGCVISTIENYSFISSPLGLVPNPNNSFYHIHHLSHPQGFSVINFIIKKASNPCYSSLKNVTDMILQTGHYYVIIKNK